MNYITRDFMSCVPMGVEMGVYCVGRFGLSGSKMVTFVVNKFNLVYNFS